MSESTASKLNVAIIGATGDLDVQPNCCLFRNPQSEGANALEALGAELLQTNGSIHVDALKGLGVLVNAAGPGINPKENDALVKEAMTSDAFLCRDTENGIYTSFSLSISDKIAATSTTDIGSTVAHLSILATTDPKSVRGEVRISGYSRFINELAEIISQANGKTIKVVEEPVIEGTDDKNDSSALARLKFSHGAADFSKYNNELVNPGPEAPDMETVDV
ncbi:hypothetical protein FRB96_004296 [Tulasnella sp. 330]|nr:hypothetical protein FRB96_004296 [Tulasnella sp. 330]KAG8881591.1 hypothetical protein FRB97_009344 [Tulasnella sp. 331]